MAAKVHCAFIEVRPRKGCWLDPGEVLGAVVRCYVNAIDADDAEERCAKALQDDHFTIVDVEWCVAVDEVEWERPDDETARQMVEAAAESGDVVFGEFHTWGTLN